MGFNPCCQPSARFESVFVFLLFSCILGMHVAGAQALRVDWNEFEIWTRAYKELGLLMFYHYCHQAYKELGLLMVLLFVCILTFARSTSNLWLPRSKSHFFLVMILHFSNPLHFRRQSNFKPHPLVHFLSLIASSPIFRPHLLCCGRFNLTMNMIIIIITIIAIIIININIIIIYSPCFSLIYFAEKDSLSKWSFTESFWWDYFCSISFSQTK